MVASTIGRPASRCAAKAVSANGCTIAHRSSATVSAASATAERDRPAAQRHRLAGQHHRRQRLADRVEQPEQQALAWHGVRPRQPGHSHGAGEHLARRTRQQCAIEVEEGRTRGSHESRLCLHAAAARTLSRRPTARKMGKTRMGDPGLSTRRSPPVGGTGVWTSPSSGTWGVFALRLLVKVCT